LALKAISSFANLQLLANRRLAKYRRTKQGLSRILRTVPRKSCSGARTKTGRKETQGKAGVRWSRLVGNHMYSIEWLFSTMTLVSSGVIGATEGWVSTTESHSQHDGVVRLPRGRPLHDAVENQYEALACCSWIRHRRLGCRQQQVYAAAHCGQERAGPGRASSSKSDGAQPTRESLATRRPMSGQRLQQGSRTPAGWSG